MFSKRELIKKISLRVAFTKPDGTQEYRIIVASEFTQEHEFDKLINHIYLNFDKKSIEITSVTKVYLYFYLV
jgi:hypothetical protein